MSATHPSARSRQKDQQIHEAFVSGLSVGEVAAEFNLAVEQVEAAEGRIEEALLALSQQERDVETQRTALRVLYRTAMEAFRQSHLKLEETERIANDSDKPAHKTSRTTKKKLPDPRYLRIALLAIAEERTLLRLDEHASKFVEIDNSKREMIDTYAQQCREHPEIADDYHHASLELLAGERLPRFKPVPKTVVS